MRRIHVGLVALAIGALGALALAQDAAPTGGAGWTGLTEPDGIIAARRALMIELERLMVPIERFSLGEPAEPTALKSAATTMAPMLLAFPHLFPPTTNLYDPDVPEPATTALPEIWQSFDSFLALAEVSAAAATTLAATDGTDALRTAGRNLRASCDACHAPFLRPYRPAGVTDEDLEFDFESVLPND